MKQIRNKIFTGRTIQANCPCGKLYVVINDDEEGSPFEVFVKFGKSGGCGSAIGNGLATVISIALRSGTRIDDIFSGLSAVGCHRSPVLDGEQKISSCVDAIAHALRCHIELKQPQKEIQKDEIKQECLPTLALAS